MLTPKAGRAACIAQTGPVTTGCAGGHGLRGARQVIVSPDGRSVYVASKDALAVFARDPSNGSLRSAGCVAQFADDGCDRGLGSRLDSMVVSPDSRYVYAAGLAEVTTFQRDAHDGTLRWKAARMLCTPKNLPGRGCPTARFFYPEALAMSRDGKNLYAGSEGGAMAILRRDPDSGRLTQPAGTQGCVSPMGGGCALGRAVVGTTALTVSGDGRNVYVGSSISDAIAVFDRDTTNGALTQSAGADGCLSQPGKHDACTSVRGLDGADSVVVSPDGRTVYVAASAANAVTVLRRGSGGDLTVMGCIGRSDTFCGYTLVEAYCDGENDSICARGRALSRPRAVTVSRDGKSVYVAAAGSDAVVVFDRDPLDGSLRQKPGARGCVTDPPKSSCAAGRGLDGAGSVAVSDDGKSVYAASPSAGAVAIFDRR